MKKFTKTIIVLFLLCIMTLNGVTAYANESQTNNTLTATPRFSNLAYASFNFIATDSEGAAIVKYTGNNAFSHVSVHIKVEKRFLLAFWNDVDEWSVSSTNSNTTLTHVFALNGNGTYRATFTLDVMATDGTVETVSDVITTKTN